MIFDSKKVAELQAQIATLESEKTQAAADMEKLECALNEKNAALEAANASVISLTARAEKAETELAAALQAKESAEAAKAAAEANAATAIASVDDKVTDRLASAGVAPIQKDVKATSQGQTMQLSEFNKLPVAQRNQFIRDGGKLTD